VPFSGGVRDIDLQGGVLIVSGLFAWIALALQRQALRLTIVEGSLLIFVLCSLVSLSVNPHFGYDLWGAPYIRLGTAGILACIGVGRLTATMKTRGLLVVLYLIITAGAIVSLPYSWVSFHYLARIPGIVAQTDVFACLLGVGLLLGLEMLVLYPGRRVWIVSAQAYMAGLLLLTETRAVLVLVVIIGLVWAWHNKVDRTMTVSVALVILVLMAGLTQIAPTRLTNSGYAADSVSYRLTLQRYALKSSNQKPLFGYGLGNLADALDCSKLSAKSLQKTCRQGYFFNSSHDIFIDRILAVGWIGGLAYLGIVSAALYSGFYNPKTRIFAYALLLIAGYYLTNVTDVVLELLLWILVFQCLRKSSRV